MEDHRLSMGLDDIINTTKQTQRPSTAGGNGNSNTGRTGPVRNHSGRRGHQSANVGPYSNSSSSSSQSSPISPVIATQVSIKLLVSNAIAGLVIGKGGANIRKFNEVTSTTTLVSSSSDHFPDTSLRVVQVTGSSAAAVSKAVAVLLEVVALEKNQEDLSPELGTWNPSPVATHEFDTTDIEVQFAIPAAAAGSVIGKGGDNVKDMIEKSGVAASLNSKSEEVASHERILRASGKTRECAAFARLVINTLAAHMDISGYEVESGHYDQLHKSRGGDRRSAGAVSATSTVRGRVAGASLGSGSATPSARVVQVPARNSIAASTSVGLTGGASLLSAETTLYLSVPDEAVGAIIGVRGSKLQEVKALSGCEITVSNKGEFIQGTTNRLITIVGAPAGAQSAFSLLNERLSEEA